VLTRHFGVQRVLGGDCRVSVQLDRNGAIRQLADFQQMRYGELDGSLTPRIRAVDELMQGVGFDAAASVDILQEMWEKWVQLAGLGAASGRLSIVWVIVVASALTLIPREIWTIRADDIAGADGEPGGAGLDVTGLDVSGLDDAGIDDPELDHTGLGDSNATDLADPGSLTPI